MNTEPDEYDCACPQGFSGKDCQIGEPLRTSSAPTFKRERAEFFLRRAGCGLTGLNSALP